MPGVSSEERGMLTLESYVPVTFFNGNATVNGEIMPAFEVSSPKFMVGEDVNFVNSRRFLAKSLSFGANPTSNTDEWHDKEEAFVSSCSPVPALVGSPFMQSDALSALHKFLPSNNEDETALPGADAYSCDEFRMYEFKVRRCMRGRSHDWTECPFAHPGEKARRRDPRRFHYSGTACPDFRKGSCRRGDACEFAHGVFECWLHPARYRTQPCKDGRNCRRRVCFFAHTPLQLRLVPAPASPRSAKSPASSYDGSPLRQAFSAVASFDGALSWDGAVSNSMGYLEGVSSPRGGGGAFCISNLSQNQSQSQSHVQVQMSSPTSTLVGQTQSPPSLSPPLSPAGSPPLSPSNWPLVAGVWNASPAFSKALNQISPAIAMSNMDSSSASSSQLHPSFALQSARRHPSITIPLNDGQGGLPSPGRVSNDASCPASSYSPISTNQMADLVTSLQHLELKNGSGGISSGNHWLHQMGGVSVHSGSPRGSNLRHCSYSLPCTPTKSRWGNKLEEWDCSEEPMQRVESGRDLRAKIYGKLSRENLDSNAEASPDLGWVNELVK